MALLRRCWSLGTSTGEFWGTVRLNRLPGQREFAADELAFMAAVAPDLAGGIRRGLVVGEATDPDRPDAPGLIIVDADGEIVSLSAGAMCWMSVFQIDRLWIAACLDRIGCLGRTRLRSRRESS